MEVSTADRALLQTVICAALSGTGPLLSHCSEGTDRGEGLWQLLPTWARKWPKPIDKTGHVAPTNVKAVKIGLAPLPRSRKPGID